jgi:NADPH-dependent 2,4-dienoyl-CoA reductase/sulfur reductase-like enzyme/bacterioferritin-associated ferredoxin
VAVIGAGPAGLAAAVAAASAGAAVTLIDEYPKPGGQYLKADTQPDAPPPQSFAAQKGRALLGQLKQLAETNVELRTGTLLWGLETTESAKTAKDREDNPQLHLALHDSRGSHWLAARTAVVATGARERVIPFPGWTLPGVMTLGAAHLLVREHGVLPGRRVLVAGSGPLMFPVVHELLQHGADVVAVLEATHLRDWLAHAPALWGQGDRLREGWTYLQDLLRHRVPYRRGHAVTRALGDGRLEAAVIARLDREGRPLPGSEARVPIDALCVGLGFVPNIELTQLAGCPHTFDPSRGGWVPTVDRQLETGVPGLYAAGEVTEVDGAGAALLEGRIAGLAAARRLGYVPADQLKNELAALESTRQRHRRFGHMLNTLFAPPSGLDAITTPDTLLCRCEEVTAGQVATAVQAGARELDALKTLIRVGQGVCQGRTCGPLLARTLARLTGMPPAAAGTFHVRPPLKPVPLGEVALTDEQEVTG